MLGCAIEHPNAPAGPCGGEGQRCCQPDEVRAMGLSINGCGAGRACTTAAWASALDGGVDGGAGAGLAAAISSRAVCRACPAGDPDVCSNSCVNLRTDTRNCGRCGTLCAGGEVCMTSSAPGDGGVRDGGASGAVAFCRQMCPAGQDFCPGRGCSNRMTDPNNCGACGNACLAGQSCAGGRCVCAGAGDWSFCSAVNRCVDLSTDSAHCGACDNPCEVGFSCTGGRCVCPGGPSNVFCPSARRCIETAADQANCGMCGAVCDAPRVPNSTAVSCSMGRCRPTTCAAGFRLSADGASCEAICGGNGQPVCAGNTCNAGFTPDPTTSGPTLCSRCGGNTQLACATDTACTTGLNACPATAGTPPVSISVCYDRQTSNENCGTCGNRCMGATPNCVAGVCSA